MFEGTQSTSIPETLSPYHLRTERISSICSATHRTRRARRASTSDVRPPSLSAAPISPMYELPAPLPPLGGALRTRLATTRDATTAYQLLWDERLFALLDASAFPSLDAAAAKALDAQLAPLQTLMSMRQMTLNQDLQTAYNALKTEGVDAIALKGVAIAPRLYPSLETRPSIDADVLISPDAVDRVHNVMQQLGWELPSGVRGSFVSGQFSYRSPRNHTLATSIDFHWRLSNRPRLNHALHYPQIAAQAVDNLGAYPYFRSISPTHALVHAIIHLIGHHRDDRIPALWWLDIAALDAQLRPQEREDALALLAQSGLLPLAAKVWRGAAEAIGFQPSKETAWLLSHRPKLSERLLLLPTSRVQEIAADLAALPGPLRRKYVQELLFPPEASLRSAYGASDAQTPIWRLHLRRLTQRGVRTGEENDRTAD